MSNMNSYYTGEDIKELELQRKKLDQFLERRVDKIDPESRNEMVEIWKLLPLHKGRVLTNILEKAMDEMIALQKEIDNTAMDAAGESL
jgi:hypothetical protein